MILFLFLVAMACVAIAALLWRRRATPGAIALLVLLGAVAQWNFAYGLEIAADGAAAKLLWAKASYFGIVCVPLAIHAFAADYTGRRSWLRWRRLALLSVIPVATLVLALSNDRHGLIWSSVEWVGADKPLALEHGPAFYVVWVWSYLLLLTASVLLIAASSSSRRFFRRQAFAVLVAMAAPWAANLVYVLGLAPGGFDVTTTAFAVTGVALAFACVRWQLLDLAPVARNTLVEHMRDGMVVLDEQLRVVDCNAATGPLMSCSTEEAIGRRAEEVLPTALAGLWTEASDHGRRDHGMVVNVHGPHGMGSYEAQVVELPGPAARYGRLLLFHDVTAREALQARLNDQALTDDLTSVGNRRYFVERTRRALLAASRHREPIAVIFIDIDDFKAINDTYGHACGDEILIAAARRLEESLRPEDAVARLGGDEFAVLLGPVEDTAVVEEVRARIVAALRQPVQVSERSHPVSASVGVHVVTSPDGQTPESLLQEADRDMYVNKRAARQG